MIPSKGVGLEKKFHITAFPSWNRRVGECYQCKAEIPLNTMIIKGSGWRDKKMVKRFKWHLECYIAWGRTYLAKHPPIARHSNGMNLSEADRVRRARILQRIRRATAVGGEVGELLHELREVGGLTTRVRKRVDGAAETVKAVEEVGQTNGGYERGSPQWMEHRFD